MEALDPNTDVPTMVAARRPSTPAATTTNLRLKDNCGTGMDFMACAYCISVSSVFAALVGAQDPQYAGRRRVKSYE